MADPQNHASRRPVQGRNKPPVVLTEAVEDIGFLSTAFGPALLVAIAGAPITLTVNLDLADDEVAIGGPDSAGVRRLFQGRVDGANNIVETVPVLAGSQTLALGKAEDTPHVSGDVGVPTWLVRKDTPGTLADTNGDYAPTQGDSAGRLRGSAVPGELSGTATSAPIIIAAASAIILATDASRRSLAIRNAGPAPVRVRPSSSPAVATDIEIANGETMQFDGLIAQSEWRAISTAATATITVFAGLVTV
jgi:hypothetical protein